MDVRKKLIEIVKKAAYSSLPSNTEDFHLNMFVTNLLSHGVTVQEWIPVKERPPEKEGWYQVYTTPDKGPRSINKAQYRKQPSWSVNAGEGYWCGSGGVWTNVTHWMPLPEPPKEE